MTKIKNTILALAFLFAIIPAQAALATLIASKHEQPAYIPDHVNFISSGESFEELDLSPKELGEWINSVDAIFAKTFEKDISNKKSANKSVGIIVTIKAIEHEPNICEEDYERCVFMKVEFNYSDNVSQSQMDSFTKQVDQLKDIRINNSSSKKEAVFMTYLNTKKK
jgi:hypothetical protein